MTRTKYNSDANSKQNEARQAPKPSSWVKVDGAAKSGAHWSRALLLALSLQSLVYATIILWKWSANSRLAAVHREFKLDGGTYCKTLKKPSYLLSPTGSDLPCKHHVDWLHAISPSSMTSQRLLRVTQTMPMQCKHLTRSQWQSYTHWPCPSIQCELRSRMLCYHSSGQFQSQRHLTGHQT